jgi:hypothetical protein
MGLRMRKSITICKGVRLNFGKSGTSLSFVREVFNKRYIQAAVELPQLAFHDQDFLM